MDNLKWGAISASIGMVLPSHGENFGVALVESLSCSKPVLTTNKVNIYNDILNFNAGFISKDNINSFAKILKKYNNLNSADLKKLSNNSLNCFKKESFFYKEHSPHYKKKRTYRSPQYLHKLCLVQMLNLFYSLYL